MADYTAFINQNKTCIQDLLRKSSENEMISISASIAWKSLDAVVDEKTAEIAVHHCNEFEFIVKMNSLSSANDIAQLIINDSFDISKIFSLCLVLTKIVQYRINNFHDATLIANAYKKRVGDTGVCRLESSYRKTIKTILDCLIEYSFDEFDTSYVFNLVYEAFANEGFKRSWECDPRKLQLEYRSQPVYTLEPLLVAKYTHEPKECIKRQRL